MLAQRTACSVGLASRSSRRLPSRRAYSTSSLRAVAQRLPPDLQWFPDFFSPAEQRALLTAALRKLDATESRAYRRKRREYAPKDAGSSVQSLFLPDEFYDFQEVRMPYCRRRSCLSAMGQGHYDGVIRRYREMHVSSWPEDVEELSRALARLRGLYPSPDVQTHLLHLASDGEILVRPSPAAPAPALTRVRASPTSTTPEPAVPGYWA